MSFEITGLEDAIEDCETAAKEITRFKRGARARLQSAVDSERTGHAYQNRTHNAETNTLLLIVGDGADADYRVEMGVEYASYLQRRWSKFGQLVKAALADIDTRSRAL